MGFLDKVFGSKRTTDLDPADAASIRPAAEAVSADTGRPQSQESPHAPTATPATSLPQDDRVPRDPSPLYDYLKRNLVPGEAMQLNVLPAFLRKGGIDYHDYTSGKLWQLLQDDPAFQVVSVMRGGQVQKDVILIEGTPKAAGTQPVSAIPDSADPAQPVAPSPSPARPTATTNQGSAPAKADPSLAGDRSITNAGMPDFTRWAWFPAGFTPKAEACGSSYLEVLAELAAPEMWTFPASPESPNPRFLGILYSHQTTNFVRLARQGQVMVNADASMAFLNTGLTDHVYRPIYAAFERNRMAGRQPWVFKGVFCAGDKGLGSVMLDQLASEPKRASYPVTDLVYDINLPLSTNLGHILVEHVERLPRTFLHSKLASSPRALAALDAVETAGDFPEANAAWDTLRGLLDSDDALQRSLYAGLATGIDVACKRVLENYRIAVPMYYPRRDGMSLLLPLGLEDPFRPDVALAIEKKNNSYRASTILTLPMAYMDARQISRPMNEWLTESTFTE